MSILIGKAFSCVGIFGSISLPPLLMGGLLEQHLAAGMKQQTFLFFSPRLYFSKSRFRKLTFLYFVKELFLLFIGEPAVGAEN